jgi:hypothetical protein
VGSFALMKGQELRRNVIKSGSGAEHSPDPYQNLPRCSRCIHFTEILGRTKSEMSWADLKRLSLRMLSDASQQSDMGGRLRPS